MVLASRPSIIDAIDFKMRSDARRSEANSFNLAFVEIIDIFLFVLTPTSHTSQSTSEKFIHRPSAWLWLKTLT
jgi:hypothetical protein